MSVTRNIAKGSVILIIGSSLGYILALGKEMLVASRFGVQSGMDAYYAALTVPNLINNVLLAAFTAIFIPIIISSQSADEARARKITNITISFLLLFLLASTVILFGIAAPLMRLGFPGFSSETGIVAAKLLREVSLVVLLTGIVGIFMGILNTRRKFLAQSLAPLFVTATLIVFIYIGGKQLSVSSLTYGLVAGTLLEAIYLYFAVRREGYVFHFDFDLRQPELRTMGNLLIPFLIGTALGQINIVVDRFMASGLGTGSIAALGYADKLVHVPTQIINASLSTAAFPFFAAQVSTKDITGLKQTLTATLRMAAFVLIPVTVLLVLFSKPLIHILFERGAFDPAATYLTANIFAMYALQLFFTAAEVLLIRVFFSLQNMKVIVKIIVLSVVFNILGNYILMRVITPAAAGIALSTSLVEAIIMVIAFWFLRGQIGPLPWNYLGRGLRKILVSSFISIIVIYLVCHQATMAVGQGNIFRQVIYLAGAALIGGALYLWLCHLLHLEEIGQIQKLVLEKINGLRVKWQRSS